MQTPRDWLTPETLLMLQTIAQKRIDQSRRQQGPLLRQGARIEAVQRHVAHTVHGSALE